MFSSAEGLCVQAASTSDVRRSDHTIESLQHETWAASGPASREDWPEV